MCECVHFVQPSSKSTGFGFSIEYRTPRSDNQLGRVFVQKMWAQ